MAESWRLARSLEVLRSEIRSLRPGTTVWTIGDAAHRASASDHNPNGRGVVCAIDVLGDKGLDLRSFADHLKTANHRAVKYVIFDRRIWSKARAAEGWRRYTGSNPHATHVHVSVGVGSDGRSTGPYDDTSPWGLAAGRPSAPGGDRTTVLGGIMFPKHGDESEDVKFWQRVLRKVLPEALPRYGDDGQWGEETTEWLARWWSGRFDSAYDGRRITAHVAFYLLEEAFAGQKGDPGEPGRDGVLELPLGVEITGKLTKAQ